MKNVKVINATLIIVAALFLTKNGNATVTISGSAVQDAPDLLLGQTYSLLVDVDGVGFSSLTSLEPGFSIESSGLYPGFEFIESGKSIAFGGDTRVNLAAEFDLASGIAAGQRFGVLVFEPVSDYTTTEPGDSFLIWTAPDWDLPGDGSTITAGTNFTSLSSTAPFSGTVAIPEPSTYAAITGLLGLSYALLRRRRRSSFSAKD